MWSRRLRKFVMSDKSLVLEVFLSKTGVDINSADLNEKRLDTLEGVAWGSILADVAVKLSKIESNDNGKIISSDEILDQILDSFLKFLEKRRKENY